MTPSHIEGSSNTQTPLFSAFNVNQLFEATDRQPLHPVQQLGAAKVAGSTPPATGRRLFSFLTRFGLAKDAKPPAGGKVSFRQAAINSYHRAKANVAPKSMQSAAHQAEMRELYNKGQPRMPLPSDVVAGTTGSSWEPRVVELPCHEFQLAKAIDAAQWMTRQYMIEGGGSATNKPELFASRGTTGLKNDFAQELEPQTRLQLPSAVLQAGSCGLTAYVSMSLFQSLDDETLAYMGIGLDRKTICVGLAQGIDGLDHGWNIAFHKNTAVNADNTPLGAKQFETTKGTVRQFQRQEHANRVWSLDAHMLYPMVCRLDEAVYDQVDKFQLLYSLPLGDYPPLLNLAQARDIREGMNRQLNLGNDGITVALREDWKRPFGIQSQLIDNAIGKQKVAHYAQLDTARLGRTQRWKLESEVEQMEREFERRLVFHLYTWNDSFTEYWAGVCLPANPATVYRCRQSNELLGPSVPPDYLEDMERKRWAFETWKRMRPDIATLRQHSDWKQVSFEIPLAVKAIENSPFLGALAAARATNYSNGTINCRMTAGYRLAFTSLEAWIQRMDDELASFPGLIKLIRDAELGSDVLSSLRRVKPNLEALREVVKRLSAEPDNTEYIDDIKHLRATIEASPSWRMIDRVLQAFAEGLSTSPQMGPRLPPPVLLRSR